MSLKPYPVYREAGVEWLDVVPEGWSIEPLRNVTRFTTGWTPPTGNADSYDGAHLWANISDLGPKRLGDTGKRLSAAAIATNNIPLSRKGSLLFSFKLTIGSVSIVEEEMYTNEAIATFRESSRLLIGFAYYAFPYCVVKNANENIYGAPMLNASLIRSARVAIPPIGEQRLIAEYLDSHTAKIDTLIEKQERLIETLAERRQAAISHAVTKGLDPNVPMKDSGIEWLGDIPESWTAYRLKHLAGVQTGLTLGKTVALSDAVELPYLRVANVQTSGVNLDEVKTVLVDRAEWSKYRLRDGDVLMTEGGDIDKLGRGCLWSNQIDPCVHQNHVFAVRCGRNIYSRMLVYLLDAQVARNYFRMTAKKTTNLASTNSTTLGNLPVALPNASEQEQIVEHLDDATAQIDALAAKAREMIDILKERRQALISAAVTGKIDVRGLS